MNKATMICMRAMSVFIAASLLAAPAFADKPEGKGKGKGKGENHRESVEYRGDLRRDEGHASGPRVYFTDRHRVLVREYHVDEHRRGFCPPGLAKKNNGCLPPGQAKKWAVGRPLPREVIYYDLPPRLVVELGTPPAGYRYVRVAADILLIAVGTAMVVDAITDLGRI